MLKILRKKARYRYTRYIGVDAFHFYTCPDCFNDVHEYLNKCPKCGRKLSFESPEEEFMKKVKRYFSDEL